MDWSLETVMNAASTQDLVRMRVDSDAGEGVCVQAISQTNGRGRHGNQWISPPGNLYLSFYVTPDIEKAHSGQLAFVTAVALSDTCDAFIDKPCKKQLKWPNDLLINGLKAAGILIEQHHDGLIVGVGLNIFAAPEYRAELSQFSGKRLIVNDVRDHFLGSFAYRYESWLKDGFTSIRDEWMRHAAFIGDTIKVRTADQVREGVFKDIDDHGRLVLENLGEKTLVTSGEVFFK